VRLYSYIPPWNEYYISFKLTLTVCYGLYYQFSSVNLAFIADRNQLFKAWPAIANLADMAGTVKVSIQAESNEGFEKSKLRNGVLEPLQEAELIE
jgi:hypothetical protein